MIRSIDGVGVSSAPDHIHSNSNRARVVVPEYA